jgi:putative CocE/NonD family hydrolase
MRAALFLSVLFIYLPFSEAFAQSFTPEDYTKQEVYIPMRDGVKLHTTIYRPANTEEDLPFLMSRSPYSSRPYGEDVMPRRIHRNELLVEDGYIFVYQDVRGRWMSEGDYATMTPNVPGPEGIDESSDTYDTIEWLLENVSDNNGKVGMSGISYPGFYTTAALPDAHPALVASSPQAPISDFYFDDFHHHGAYLMSYWFVTNLFGIQHDGPTDSSWYSFPDLPTRDAYHFYLNEMTPLTKAKNYYNEDNFFWNELSENPNYNEFWQSRDILRHLKGIDHAILTVGGWFDAEDLYGPLMTYKTIEKNNPEAENMIVMGPWSHGDWSRGDGPQLVGDIYFGDNIATFFKVNMEEPFFRHYLKGEGEMGLPEAWMFDTGKNSWEQFETWPPKKAEQKRWYVHEDGSLSDAKPGKKSAKYSEYVSDIDKPVPYTEHPLIRFTPRPFMTSDQRFAARRPDVVTFETDVLTKDVTVAGEMLANLFVSTSGTASDWIVKLIDVYPPSVEESKHTPDGVELDNYHQMVRNEVIRGRFRNSYEKPEPFKPNKVAEINLPLQDIYHTFKKGHKIQIQIQSTFFPYIDLNPQKYVENIFEAKESDFQDAIQRIYHSEKYPTNLSVDILE